MPVLEEGIQAWIDRLKAAVKNIPATETLAEHREYLETRVAASVYPIPENIQVRDRWLEAPGRQIPLRVYRPKEKDKEALPTLLFLHGGGFIAGSISTAGLYCYGLAEITGAQVIAVNYRLAPENPFPAAPDDCYFALCWVAENTELLGTDRNRIAVGGDSAGGALTAALTILSRDRNGPKIAFQYLMCGMFDCDLDGYEKMDNQDPFSPKKRFLYFWENYLQGKFDTTDPVAVPMRLRDARGLPPAYVLTPEHHLLRPEGIRYAEKLKAAGVPTELRVVPGTMHTFLRARFVSKLAEAEFQHMGKAIIDGLAK